MVEAAIYNRIRFFAFELTVQCFAEYAASITTYRQSIMNGSGRKGASPPQNALPLKK